MIGPLRRLLPFDEVTTRTYRARDRAEVNRRMSLDAARLARQGWEVDWGPHYTHLLNWAAEVRYRRRHR